MVALLAIGIGCGEDTDAGRPDADPDGPTDAGPGDGDAGAPGEIIAFHSERDGNAEIYVMNVDGTGLMRLTNQDGDDVDPSVSPDGHHIAFQSGRDGNAEIYVMNADGTGAVRLTNDPADDVAPEWSPDGTKISWVRGDFDGQNLWVMNTDGTGQTQLTMQSGESTNAPAWSPDGLKIAFESNRDAGTYEVYVMDADGTDQTRVTTTGGGHPCWTPDGRIVYQDEMNALWTIHPDGTGAMALTTAGTYSHPEVSLDGTLIVADSGFGGGNTEIVTLHIDGSSPTRLTTSPGLDRDATFGRRVK